MSYNKLRHYILYKFKCSQFEFTQLRFNCIEINKKSLRFVNLEPFYIKGIKKIKKSLIKINYFIINFRRGISFIGAGMIENSKLLIITKNFMYSDKNAPAY